MPVKKSTSAGSRKSSRKPSTATKGTQRKSAEQAATSGNAEVIFKPNDGPQTEFLAASEQEVLYGGAAGGGKSFAIVADPMRYFSNPEFQGLLLRRTTDELRELIRVSKQLYPKVFKGAKFVERDKTWYFQSGASFWMSYLERDDDVMRYQGQAFSWIGFDELTQWPTPHAWQYLSSRLRTSGTSGLPLCQRATTNPGGPGHAWVKKMFIDPAEWGTAFDATDIETGKILCWPENHSDKDLAGTPLFKRKFIPAKLSDNPYLHTDGRYEANLLSLPEQQRRQLLEGGWDITEGVAFPEWNRFYHVSEPWEIPDHWPRFRSCDYGYNDPSSVVWFAVAPDNQLIVYREIHIKGVVAEDLAVMVAEAEGDERVSYGILDSSMWNNMGESGPSRAEKMNLKLREYGCRPFRKSDRSKGSRLDRKNEFHRRLKLIDDTPGIIFFNNCLSCISTIPTLQLDKNNPEDVDTKADDHDYDAVTYGIMSRPLFREKTSGHRNGWTPASSVFGY